MVSLVGIVFSLPIGIALALGRRSELPVRQAGVHRRHRAEPRRAVDPVLFMFNTMLPLFQPEGLRPTACCGPWSASLFASAYMAEVVRGGPVSPAPKGSRGELKISVLANPPSHRAAAGIAHRRRASSTPSSACSGDTTLVAMVGILDLLKVVEVGSTIRYRPRRSRATPAKCVPGFFYCACCYAMSRYSRYGRVDPGPLRTKGRHHEPSQAVLQDPVSAIDLDRHPAVEMRKVSKWYGNYVLRDVDLTVGKGERIVVCSRAPRASRR